MSAILSPGRSLQIPMTAESWATGALAVLLVWLPLPLASNRPWAWFLMGFAAMTVFAAAVASTRQSGKSGESLAAYRAVFVAFSLWLAYTLVQALPLPIGLVSFVSPASGELQAFAAGEGGSGWARLTVDVGATLAELIKNASYIALLASTVLLATTRARLRFLMGTIVAAGAVQAGLGLGSHFAGVNLLAFDPTTAGEFSESVRGTFVNRNHFAQFLLMCSAAGLGLVVSRSAGRSGAQGWRQRLVAAMDGVLDTGLQRAILIVLMIAAVLFSGSRGAALSFAAAFAAVVVLAALLHGRRAPEVRFAPWLGVAALLAVVWLGAGSLAERLLTSDFGTDERLVQWEMSLPLIRDYPLTGVGAGNYVNAFPLYRDGTLRPLTYDRAHSDYLELLIDQGIVGVLLLGGALLMAYRRIIAAYRRRHDPLARGILFAALLGTLSPLLHASVEFVFHIPAISGYFFVLLGLGLAAARIERDPSGKSSRRSRHSVNTWSSV